MRNAVRVFKNNLFAFFQLLDFVLFYVDDASCDILQRTLIKFISTGSHRGYLSSI